MRLWDKGLPLDQRVEAYTVGDDPELDLQLLVYDCRASKAHARMLANMQILSEAESEDLLAALDEVIEQAQQGRFEIRREDEDGHTAIERYLTQRCGEAGKKIHTARSRNDQVLTAMRLLEKERLAGLDDSLDALQKAIERRRVQHAKVELPGWTHMRKAMPATLDMWFGAYVAALGDDRRLLATVAEIIDQSPLGSAAGFGVPLDIDRQMTADELGFARVQPTMYCQNSRGKLEAMIVDGLGQVMMDLDRMASDLILFSESTFGFFGLPAELCTGSSIMPQKQNPDVLELIRGHHATVQGASVQLKMLYGARVSGYHRDLQLSKGPTLRCLQISVDSVDLMALVFEKLTVNEGRCKAALSDELYATERAYALVEKGVPFRDAYRQIARTMPAADDPT